MDDILKQVKLIFICGIAGIGGYFASDKLLEIAIPSPSNKDAIIHAIESSQFSEIYDVVKQYSQDDYDTIIGKIVQISRTSRSEEQAFERGIEVFTDFHRNNASSVMSAPDKYLSNVIELHTVLYNAIQTKDPLLCSQVAISGMRHTNSTDFTHVTAIAVDLAAATMRAIYEGRASGRPRRVATNQDWERFGAYWWNNGATKRDIASMERVSSKDRNLCPALTSMMNASLTMPGKLGERIRASWVQDIVSQ